MKCRKTRRVEARRGPGKTASLLPLWLSNAILNESCGHINNSVLVWNDADSKLLLDLQQTQMWLATFDSSRMCSDTGELQLTHVKKVDLPMHCSSSNHPMCSTMQKHLSQQQTYARLSAVLPLSCPAQASCPQTWHP